MKQRVITAVIALIIFLPLLYLGGIPFDILVTLMGIVAMSEFLIMKKKLQWPRRVTGGRFRPMNWQGWSGVIIPM